MAESTNHVDWDLLSSYAGLLSLAVFSIYTGSFGSLPPFKYRPTKQAKEAGAVSEQESEEEESQQPERLSSQDAWLFPIIGSVVLFGLYVIVKYFGKEWINWFLQWYFTLAGLGCGAKALISLVRAIVGPQVWKKFDLVTIVVAKGSQRVSSISVRTPSVCLIPLGALPSILYSFGPSYTRRSALLTDILALTFAFNGLSFLTIDSFKTGCILLSGLFLYDIWWVFGTEVMVKVATTLDVPIKLLWTKSLTFSTEHGFTMLGLGDIVVPGMFIALALRYDQHKASAAGQSPRNWNKPYFYAALTAYVLGLVTTMTVMHVFHAAQPALLYLSPACMLSFFITASAKGDFADAWSWTEEASVEPKSRPNIDGNGTAKSAASTPVDAQKKEKLS